jgi:hypothetical protein
MRHVRLTIEAHYHEPAAEPEIRDRLDALVARAAGEGMFTGDGAMEVESWSHDIHFFVCPHEYEQLSARHADGTKDIIDVRCRHCGAPGSFTVPQHDINWE